MEENSVRELDTLLRLGAAIVRLGPREKRPLGGAWHARASRDFRTVCRWIGEGYNVGLLLGPESGVIDVESDTAEAEEIAVLLGLDRTETTSWRSRRGLHRLYRWAPWMPSAASIKIGGLEVRIGGRAAQSVLPPSIHPTGIPYRWEVRPFVSDAELCVADVPEALRAAMEESYR
jgi:hypothetical protein